jgi:predicted Fe-S protein YdhL (DUF1289 family)
MRRRRIRDTRKWATSFSFTMTDDSRFPNFPRKALFPMASNLHDLPDSPCIGVCSTLFDEVCKGCGRTAGEVSNWVFLTDDEKRAVWERITREGTAMRFKYDKL